MKRIRKRLVGCICAVVVATPVTAEVTAESSTLDGRYVLDTAHSDNIEQVIKREVADLSFIIRPIARSRLTKTNPTYQRIEIGRNMKFIMVKLDDRKPISMPLDGSTIDWIREDGEKFRVRADVKPQSLMQTFSADEGRRVNRFSFVEQRLVLQVTLESDRLSKPITYSLSYRRE